LVTQSKPGVDVLTYWAVPTEMGDSKDALLTVMGAAWRGSTKGSARSAERIPSGRRVFILPQISFLLKRSEKIAEKIKQFKQPS